MLGGSTGRRSVRYQILLPVLFQATPMGALAPIEGSGWTRNLSETGACLELSEPLTLRAALRVTLLDEGGSVVLEAAVAWVGHPRLPAGGTLHGVVFGPLTLHQRLVLQTLCRRHAGLRAEAMRLPAALPVLCHPLGAVSPPLRGWTGDLGREGCLLLLPERLPVGTLLALSLTTPRGDVPAEATVVWVEPALSALLRTFTRHGVRFVAARGLQAALLPLLRGDVTVEVNEAPPAG
jgi:hypothetical protein